MREAVLDLIVYANQSFNIREAIVITTNLITKRDGSAVMGAGIAKQAALQWPNLPKMYGEILNLWGSDMTSRAHIMAFLRSAVIAGSFEPSMYNHGPLIVCFPTKTHWRYLSNITLIENCLIKLCTFAEKMQLETVWLPRLGCSNGGLDWETEVKPLLTRYLDNRFVVVTTPPPQTVRQPLYSEHV